MAAPRALSFRSCSHRDDGEHAAVLQGEEDPGPDGAGGHAAHAAARSGLWGRYRLLRGAEEEQMRRFCLITLLLRKYKWTFIVWRSLYT